MISVWKVFRMESCCGMGGGVSGGHEATLRKRLAFVQIKGWGGGVGGLAEDLPLRMLAANLG